MSFINITALTVSVGSTSNVIIMMSSPKKFQYTYKIKFNTKY